METNIDIFSNVPHSPFFVDGRPQYEKVQEFLDFQKLDYAKATGVPEASIRFDKRIPKELEDRLFEIASILSLILDHFKGDEKKAVLWFKIPNPLLGNMSPRDVIRFGRYKKLLKFIMNSKSGNNG